MPQSGSLVIETYYEHIARLWKSLLYLSKGGSPRAQKPVTATFATNRTVRWTDLQPFFFPSSLSSPKKPHIENETPSATARSYFSFTNRYKYGDLFAAPMRFSSRRSRMS